MTGTRFVHGHTPSGASGSAPIAMRDFRRSLPMALMRARESVMVRFRPALAEHGLSEQQWRVLRALTSREAPISVGELADDTCLLGPSLSRMIVSMEERSLITRTIDPADARRTGVSIAPAGIDLVARIAPLSEEVYRTIEADFGAGSLGALHELLDRLADVLITDSAPAVSAAGAPAGSLGVRS
jgi:homoprotocatechuate degradation regulator HpaR